VGDVAGGPGGVAAHDGVAPGGDPAGDAVDPALHDAARGDLLGQGFDVVAAIVQWAGPLEARVASHDHGNS
jgi:hypothetical protein